MIVLKTVISSEIGVEGKKVIHDTLSNIDEEFSQSHGWDMFDDPLDNTPLIIHNLKSTIDQFIQKNLGKSFECKLKNSLEDFTFLYEASRMTTMT